MVSKKRIGKNTVRIFYFNQFLFAFWSMIICPIILIIYSLFTSHCRPSGIVLDWRFLFASRSISFPSPQYSCLCQWWLEWHFQSFHQPNTNIWPYIQCSAIIMKYWFNSNSCLFHQFRIFKYKFDSFLLLSQPSCL